jgi:hypothetical protein
VADRCRAGRDLADPGVHQCYRRVGAAEFVTNVIRRWWSITAQRAGRGDDA